MSLSYSWAKKTFEDYGYKFFTKPMSLNIFGIRANESTPNSFDDVICLAYIDKNGEEVFKMYQGSTDPGLAYLEGKMLNPKGTLILPAGQHLKLFKLGLHHRKYTALVQNRSVKVIRDGDKDGMLDFDSKVEDYGMFGLNLHRCNKNSLADSVSVHSAGCQILRDIIDWNEFIGIIMDAADVYGKVFTYTLFDERNFDYGLSGYFGE